MLLVLGLLNFNFGVFFGVGDAPLAEGTCVLIFFEDEACSGQFNLEFSDGFGEDEALFENQGDQPLTFLHGERVTCREMRE